MSPGKLKSFKLPHIFIIIGIGILSTIPLLFCENYFADDIATHLPFAKYFAKQFWSGDLYPRWLYEANAGLGSPAFFFYPPVPYYFTSLFQPFLALLDDSGWSQLCLSSSLALVLSGITCYMWLEKISNRYSAIFGAIVYMLWPYHLGFDLYHRFAFAEFWAFVWLPLIAYYSVLALENHTIPHLLGLSFSLTLLIMTHLLTFILFFPFWLVYVVISVGIKRLTKILTVILIPTVIAFGLSAIYWYPAIKTQYNISPEAWWDLFNTNNLLFIDFPSQAFAIRYYEVIAILGAIVSILLFRMSAIHLASDKKLEVRYWIGTSLVSIFMMSILSQPIWSSVSILQKVQYSFRFHSILNIAISALVTLAVFSLKTPIILSKNLLKISKFALLISTLSVVVYFAIYYNFLAIGGAAFSLLLILACRIGIIDQPRSKYFLVTSILIISLILSSFLMVQKYILNRRNVGEHEVIAQAILVGKSPPEYRPRWVSKELFNLQDPWDTKQLIEVSEKSRSNMFAQGTGKVEIIDFLPRKIVLRENADVDSVLNIPQFYYSGWTALIKGESKTLKTMPSNSNGILQISIPPGEHDLILKLEAGYEERIGQFISFVTILITLVLAIKNFRAKKRRKINLEMP
jgi:hypothetical protein